MPSLTPHLSAPIPMEHRWGERVQLDNPAFLVLPDGASYAGRVRNASISGAWVETVVRMPMYSAVTIVLSTGAGERKRTIELPACVVRTTRAGAGVEWRDMGVPTLASLLRDAGGDEVRLRTRDRTVR